MQKLILHEELILNILYGSSSGRRFTQDTPVLPEVWIELAKNPNLQTSCLIVPRRGNQAHHVADELNDRLVEFRALKSIKRQKRKGSSVSDMPGLISTSLYFDEIVNIVLPLTRWWQSDGIRDIIKHCSQSRLLEIVRDKTKILTNGDEETFDLPKSLAHCEIVDTAENSNSQMTKKILIPESAMRQIILIGLIGFKSLKKNNGNSKTNQERTIRDLTDIKVDDVVRGLGEIIQFGFLQNQEKPYSEYYRRLRTSNGSSDENQTSSKFETKLIFMLSFNRDANVSASDSIKTVKADAAALLFDITTSKICWAIIDSGIDAKHPAFQKLSPKQQNRILTDEKR